MNVNELSYMDTLILRLAQKNYKRAVTVCVQNLNLTEKEAEAKVDELLHIVSGD